MYDGAFDYNGNGRLDFEERVSREIYILNQSGVYNDPCSSGGRLKKRIRRAMKKAELEQYVERPECRKWVKREPEWTDEIYYLMLYKKYKAYRGEIKNKKAAGRIVSMLWILASVGMLFAFLYNYFVNDHDLSSLIFCGLFSVASLAIALAMYCSAVSETRWELKRLREHYLTLCGDEEQAKRIRKFARNDRLVKLGIAAVCVTVLAAVIWVGANIYLKIDGEYNDAVALAENGQYAEAAGAFTKIGLDHRNYKDTEAYRFYCYACIDLQQGDYWGAWANMYNADFSHLSPEKKAAMELFEYELLQAAEESGY